MKLANQEARRFNHEWPEVCRRLRRFTELDNHQRGAPPVKDELVASLENLREAFGQA